MQAVVEWNLGVLADLAGRPLDDRRTERHEADVVQLITAVRGDYDAIMPEADNGAEAMVRKGSNWLYSLPGLTATYASVAARRGIGDMVCRFSTAIRQTFATCRLRGG